MAIERKRRSFVDVFDKYFDDMERELDRWRESLVEGPSWNLKASTMEPLKSMRVLPTEVVVTVDLPMTKESSLKVNALDENTLEISAQMRRKITFKELGITQHKGEFQRFHAHMRVPVAVQMKKMKTKFKKGMLEIHIPRKRGRGRS
jgi:HSP20 family molecular chaperone IbpA